ncbi:hypothetical protein [Streptomyces sp. NPDC018610]|uniref:hypothetical protein n=1 Tax=Streptomyces sp. NPDC018610 TaxID=3365049 RepID=UPI0037989BB6
MRFAGGPRPAWCCPWRRATGRTADSRTKAPATGRGSRTICSRTVSAGTPADDLDALVGSWLSDRP